MKKTFWKWTVLTLLVAYAVGMAFWAHGEASRNVCRTIDVRVKGREVADSMTVSGIRSELAKYPEKEELVKEKVKAIVCMGKDNSKLLDFFTGKVPLISDTHSIEEAVKECARIAEDGDTVLLSPCCASFDLFKSYEDRGEKFKAEVRKLS